MSPGPPPRGLLATDLRPFADPAAALAADLDDGFLRAPGPWPAGVLARPKPEPTPLDPQSDLEKLLAELDKAYAATPTCSNCGNRHHRWPITPEQIERFGFTVEEFEHSCAFEVVPRQVIPRVGEQTA